MLHKKLMERLWKRRLIWPNDNFININVVDHPQTNTEILKWLDDTTTGHFYLTFGLVAFENEDEATLFTLRFV